MIRRISLIALAAIAWCIASTSAPADELLSTRSFSINRSNNIFTTDQFKLEIEFGNREVRDDGTVLLVFPNPDDMLFKNLAITPANVGQIFTSLPGDLGFADAAARVTNSFNQAIRFVLTETASTRPEKRGYAENMVLNRPLLTPDFAGWNISRFEIRIDSFNLSSGPPASAPAASATMPVDVKFTFSVYGVPEPTTATLGAGALAMFTLARYSGRRKSGR